MDLETFRWLLTDDGQALLARRDRGGGDAARRCRRRCGETRDARSRSPRRSARSSCVRTAAAKFGDDAARMYFTRDGLEQATRAPVADAPGRPARRRPGRA